VVLLHQPSTEGAPIGASAETAAAPAEEGTRRTVQFDLSDAMQEVGASIQGQFNTAGKEITEALAASSAAMTNVSTGIATSMATGLSAFASMVNLGKSRKRIERIPALSVRAEGPVLVIAVTANPAPVSARAAVRANVSPKSYAILCATPAHASMIAQAIRATMRGTADRNRLRELESDAYTSARVEAEDAVETVASSVRKLQRVGRVQTAASRTRMHRVLGAKVLTQTTVPASFTSLKDAPPLELSPDFTESADMQSRADSSREALKPAAALMAAYDHTMRNRAHLLMQPQSGKRDQPQQAVAVAIELRLPPHRMRAWLREQSIARCISLSQQLRSDGSGAGPSSERGGTVGLLLLATASPLDYTLNTLPGLNEGSEGVPTHVIVVHRSLQQFKQLWAKMGRAWFLPSAPHPVPALPVGLRTPLASDDCTALSRCLDALIVAVVTELDVRAYDSLPSAHKLLLNFAQRSTQPPASAGSGSGSGSGSGKAAGHLRRAAGPAVVSATELHTVAEALSRFLFSDQPDADV
jgi:hypothetical protein